MRRFFCLAILLYLTLSSDACQRQLIHKCISSYLAELDERPDDGSHCARLRDVVRCFWSERDCKGPQIRRWREWVIMVATLEKFLHICKFDRMLQNIYDRERLEDSKLKSFYEHLRDTTISDKDKQCAEQVHFRCKKQFVKAVRNNRRICDDGQQWLECYKGSNCDEQSAIVRYAKYVAELAPSLVADCKSEL